MRRYNLILGVVTCLALCVFGVRSANATLVKVDFQVEILQASYGNPFGVAVGDPYYSGYTIYDDTEVSSNGEDSVVIAADSDYRLSVTVGDRIVNEWEDIYYLDGAPNYYRPTVYFLDGAMVGFDLWVEPFSHKTYHNMIFDAFYEPDPYLHYYDLVIFDNDSLPELVDANFVNFSPPTPIPEPATMLLLGTGIAGLAGLRRRFKKA